ncbi:MAG: sigma-54-dependent Fis family transcriptional regulator [Acidobacteria bacterium]|nr:sigma-54-dependent Fis family transcriptional regulator [Acidobacteriota bacterium]
MKGRVLIVDDEEGVRSSLAGVLEDEGFEVTSTPSGEECLDILKREDYDVILLDIWLPKMDGLKALEEIKKLDETLQVVMISGHGTIETAVKATKLGAFDFIEKPLSLDKTLLVVKNALKQKKLEEENRRLRETIEKRYKLIGESEAMKRLKMEIAIAAPTNGRVLIVGENGTGKELVARNIHYQSLRREGPFVEVNCAAIPDELIESELFGHKKGAFTGAIENKVGKFKLADGGTLFLDEIGDMSLRTQAKVLRSLEEGKFEPVGETKAITVDVRVIAATNKDLEREIGQGNFRKDLFYRLNVIPIHVPPLRERKEDIPLLADHFITLFSAEYGKKVKRLSLGAISALTEYHWPGNVRELKNIIERLVIMVPEDTIEEKDVQTVLSGKSLAITEPSSSLSHNFSSLREARASFERNFILKKLTETGYNISATARLLGVERSHLHKKMKTLGIKLPPGRRRKDE